MDSSSDEYIKTTTHNYISRKAVIEGPRQVEVKGRSILHEAVKIRGDLGIVRIGRYVWIERDTVLEPAPLMITSSSNTKRVPMMIGNHTWIGANCQVEAAAIGSMVSIGNDVKIGKRCIIKDCCVIDSNVVLGDDTVVPPFTRVFQDGNNNDDNVIMAELPPSMTVELQEKSMDLYHDFSNSQRVK
jgi:dynactin-5